MGWAEREVLAWRAQGILRHHRAQRAERSRASTPRSTGLSCTTWRRALKDLPVLLVHGFPETWWTFRKLIPLLAATHRVYAVDLRGFGDSDNGSGAYDSKTSAEDLHLLIEELNVGPVHLTGQDISGATVLRLAATHPEDVRSFTAIEMGLPGFGLEMLADVTHWGYLAHRRSCHPQDARDAPRRSRAEFLGQLAFSAMSATPGANHRHRHQQVRPYLQPFRRLTPSAIGLCQSMLQESDEIATLVAGHKLNIPVLAIGAAAGSVRLSQRSAKSAPIQSDGDSRRRRPLHGSRGARPGGACPSRLLQHRHGRLKGIRVTERTPRR